MILIICYSNLSDLLIAIIVTEVKAPIAFEVTGTDEENGDSIIKSHPPKRFVRLEDEQYNLSQDEIEKRQALAEQRRTEVIHFFIRKFKFL